MTRRPESHLASLRRTRIPSIFLREVCRRLFGKTALPVIPSETDHFCPLVRSQAAAGALSWIHPFLFDTVIDGSLAEVVVPRDLRDATAAIQQQPHNLGPKLSRELSSWSLLLVMHLQAVEDHVQTQPDYPHARAHLLGWADAAHAWYRLNPDTAYMLAVSSAAPGADSFPDNEANTTVAWPAPESQMVPNALAKSIKLAGALELADRAHAGDASMNLSATLIDYQPVPDQSSPAGPGKICVEGETEKCCGDGSCDGPEDAQNCAPDCGE